jgi:hypothetical protein
VSAVSTFGTIRRFSRREDFGSSCRRASERDAETTVFQGVIRDRAQDVAARAHIGMCSMCAGRVRVMRSRSRSR